MSYCQAMKKKQEQKDNCAWRLDPTATLKTNRKRARSAGTAKVEEIETDDEKSLLISRQ